MAMKFYTHDEMLDKHVGKKGTVARDNFDAEVEAALIGASIKEVERNAMPRNTHCPIG